MSRNKNIFEFIRFVIVGTTATMIHYSIYYLLHSIFNIELNISYTLGYGISFIFNFIASNHFTFKTKVSVKKGAKFIIDKFLNNKDIINEIKSNEMCNYEFYSFLY